MEWLQFIVLFFSTANAYSTQRKQIIIPKRTCRPPFPDGPCGGNVVTLSDLYTDSWWLPARNISVWLPPNYHDDSQQQQSSSYSPYPVLYCHDGQNAMSDDSSWTGHSWRLMGAITRLYEHGKIPHMPVVVMIPSADDEVLFGMRRRHLEYGDATQVFAQSHVQFVAHCLQPSIMRQFAVSTNPQDHYLIGSSMGGQASLHILLQNPHQFGGAACLSPYFGNGLLSLLEQQRHVLQDKKLYIDIGGDMKDVRVPILDVLDLLTSNHPGFFWLDTALQSGIDQALKWLPPHQLHYMEFPGARHNERAWSLRMDKPIISLLAKRR